MENLFDTVFGSSGMSIGTFFLMLGVALVTGVIFSFIISWRTKGSNRLFIVTSLLPAAVGLMVALVNGLVSTDSSLALATGIGIAGAFGLIRFRSAPGTGEDIVSVFIAAVSGIAFGMGYLAYGVCFALVMAFAFIGLTFLPIFNHKNLRQDKLLNVTIPESLDYDDVFKDTFDHYLSSYETLRVKTTAMGSMFKLSFKVRLKNPKEEKELIDEIRTKNGNLEVAMLPYAENTASL